MKFDYVHDIQKAYRKLVDCVAKPGTINSLHAESQKLNLPDSCSKSMLVLMLMLLDTEVSFHIIGKDAEKISKNISQLTYSPVATLDEADFIYVLADAQSDQLAQAINDSKLGTLVDPHLSATLIIEVNELKNEEQLILTGPGIEVEKHLKNPLELEWVNLRALKNIEYPLGIEMYFIDKKHQLLALPRTTKISN